MLYKCFISSSQNLWLLEHWIQMQATAMQDDYIHILLEALPQG